MQNNCSATLTSFFPSIILFLSVFHIPVDERCNELMPAIEKKSATQLSIDYLYALIQKDSVKVGDCFPTEKELCRQLGVGRGTLREAVKVLVSQGLLEIRPGIGTFVKSKSVVQQSALSEWFQTNEVELQDLISVRSIIEPYAARQAIEKCTSGQLSRLKMNEAAAEKAAASNDSVQLAVCDEEFHRMIFIIADNKLLIEINELITRNLAQFRQNTFKIKNNVDNFIPAHAAILRAFEAHDPALGERKMRQHIKKIAKDLTESKYNS